MIFLTGGSQSNVSDRTESNTQQSGEEGKVFSGGGQIFPLSISPSYVKDWDAVAAFRELYQNW